MLAALALLAIQDGGALPPSGDARTLGASIAVVECIKMREGMASPQAFVAAVPSLRQRLAADPRLAGVAVDDAGGRGCRVSFTGTPAEADYMAVRARSAPGQLLFSQTPQPGGARLISTTLTYPTRRPAASN
jgi:hypothetical protein